MALGVALAGTLGAGACARPSAPPGGPPDRIPPFVVGTEPDTFAVVGARRDAVRIRFSERISERSSSGSLDDAVLVSPRPDDVRVRHRRDALDVRVEGGFRPGRVYRVTVLPVVRDLFGNVMGDPFELVFSTGGELEPGILAGLVTDRITDRPAPGVTVDAVRQEDPDSAIYTARTDTAGIFVLRFLPAGTWDVTAYEDRNRNQRADFQEPQARSGFRLEQADTQVVALRVLPLDTTAAVLTRGELVDSVTLRLTFDDHLDPESSLMPVQVSVEREDGAARIDGLSLLHAHLHERRQRERAEAARAAADTAAPDTAAPGPPPGPPEGVPGAVRPPEPEREGPPLPAQSLYVLLPEPMEPEVPYRVTVSGVTNLHGIPDGGGEVLVRRPRPPEPPPDAAVPDTAALPDTTAVPDTTRPPDTVQVRPAGRAPGTPGRP